MIKKVEFEAKNLTEAERIAKDLLKMPVDKIKFTVLKEKKGILGIGASTFYLAEIDVNLALEGKSYIENIAKYLGIEIKMELRTQNEGKEIYYHLFSEENALLIGRNGNTLRSLQYLVRNYLNTFSEEFVIVNIDIGNYNENRKRQLEILATKTAKEVAQTRIEVKLDPMNGYERRIIHTKLSDWRDVVTESVGDGEDRSIIIKPVRK